MKKILLLGVGLFISQIAFPQKVSVNVEGYRHEFNGLGSAFGLYNGNWINMSESDRDEAARLTAQDLDFRYLKTYVGDLAGTESETNSYDYFAIAYNDLLKYKPDLKVQVTVNNLPDDLEMAKGDYDPNIPDIFTKIAEYYFNVIEDFKDRDIVVDQLDVLNEPGGETKAIKKGMLFSESIPILRQMINDPAVNTKGLIMPQVVGVSTWSVLGVTKWFDAWRNGFDGEAAIPEAYEQIDVVSTHGYREGWDEKNFQDIYDYIRATGKDFPFQNNEQTAKLQNGDGLNEIFGSEEPDHIGDVSIAMRMSDAINGGVNEFFVFQINNDSGNNASLLKTGASVGATKSKIYDGVKHISSLHPSDSNVLEKTLTDLGTTRVLCYRKQGEDDLYVNITNITADNQVITIDANASGSAIGFDSVQAWSSTETKDIEEVLNQTFASPVSDFKFNATPYSVNTLKFKLASGAGTVELQEQTITFNPIEDAELGDSIMLAATSSSGLPVSFEIYSGNATIEGNQITFEKPGSVIVRALQNGNESYYAASDVFQTLTIENKYPNIALGKSVTVNSAKSGQPGSAAVDGNITDDEGRWVTDKGVEYPHWIELDLDKIYDIESIAFWSGGGNEFKQPPYDFKFQTWNEDTDAWDDVFEEVDNTDSQYFKAFNRVSARKVRLYITDGDKPETKLYELEIYGEESILSVEERELKRSLKYPNPISQDVVELNSESVEIKNVILYNISGVKVRSYNSNRMDNLFTLSNGLYILKVNNFVVGSVIINR